MAQHLAAFYKSSYGETGVEMTALPDDVLTRTSDTRFMVPADLNRIRWGAALGENLKRAYFKAPSLEVRRIIQDIIPHVRGEKKFPLNGFPIFRPFAPIELIATEEVSAILTTDGSSAGDHVVLVSFSPADLPPRPAGDIRVVRCTSNTTLTAFKWTTCKLTPDVQLEAGTYSLIGFLAISANAIAARAIIHGQVWRPGLPAFAGAEEDVKELNNRWLTELADYNMGSFTHLTLPEIQFLSAAADTSEVVYLYVVKTS